MKALGGLGTLKLVLNIGCNLCPAIEEKLQLFARRFLLRLKAMLYEVGLHVFLGHLRLESEDIFFPFLLHLFDVLLIVSDHLLNVVPSISELLFRFLALVAQITCLVERI